MWDVKFHPFKCNVLTATRTKDTIHADYELHGQILERVKSIGYLGLTIQAGGQWNEHIENIAQKGNRLLGFLRRNLTIGSKTIKGQAYKMLLRPCLEYACTVWYQHTETDSSKLERKHQ